MREDKRGVSTGVLVGILVVCSILLVIIIIALISMTSSSSDAKETEQLVQSLNGQQTQSEGSTISDFFTDEILSGSKDLLPTIGDFEVGWEMIEDEPKDKSTWSLEDQEKGKERGFIEGHVRDFQKGSMSLADLKNVEKIALSISLYSSTGVKEVLEDDRSLIVSGEYTSTSDDREEEIISVSALKDPEIGDQSLMWSETIDTDSIMGEIKKYYISFVKDNVYVKIGCFSFETQTSINNCITYAEIVEKNIERQ